MTTATARMARVRSQISCLVLALTTLVATTAGADGMTPAGDYLSERQRLVDAFGAKDYDTMVEAARRALGFRPGYPNARYNLSLAQVLNGDLDGAMAMLASLAAQSIDVGADEAELFEPLRTHARWDDYLASLTDIRRPVGTPVSAFALDREDFVPEGIAMLDDDTVLLGSIRHGHRVAVGRDGAARSMGTTATGGPWSVFGMRHDGDGQLWFASAAVPQLADRVEADAGRTGLFRLDPATGRITARWLWPADDREHVFGDLDIDAHGRLYATDSLTGALVCYDPVRKSGRALLRAGTFNSPQGLVFAADGRTLFVADYTGGLFRVDVETLERTRLETPDTVSLYGVDGLYRHGNALIAIQNGIRPHRVVRLGLSADGRAVTTSRILAMNLPDFDEPTLGTIRGDKFFFVANSHWYRFGADNALPDGLAGPVVLSIPLD